MPGWYVEKGHLELQNGPKGQTARGPDFKDTQLELDAHFNSIISQDVVIEHAGTYELEFNASGRRSAMTSKFNVVVIQHGAELEGMIQGKPAAECDEAAGATRIKRLRDSLGNQMVSALLVKNIARQGYMLSIDKSVIRIL